MLRKNAESLSRVRLKCEGWMRLGKGFLFFVLRICLLVCYFMSIDVLLCGCLVSFSCISVVTSCRGLLFCDIFMYRINLCKAVLFVPVS